MKPNQLATLVLRLLGIYCLIQAVPLLGMLSSIMVLARMNSEESASAFAASVLPGTLMLIMGILLLVFSVWLGEKLTRQTSAEENISKVTFEQIQALAFAVAGVLIFTDALPQLLNSISYLISLTTSRSSGDQQIRLAYRADSFREGSAAAGIVFKAALGLLLFFRARGFANFWRSLRTFATPKPSQPEQ